MTNSYINDLYNKLRKSFVAEYIAEYEKTKNTRLSYSDIEQLHTNAKMAINVKILHRNAGLDMSNSDGILNISLKDKGYDDLK